MKNNQNQTSIPSSIALGVRRVLTLVFLVVVPLKMMKQFDYLVFVGVLHVGKHQQNKR